jgi:hypothetical protein
MAPTRAANPRARQSPENCIGPTCNRLDLENVKVLSCIVARTPADHRVLPDADVSVCVFRIPCWQHQEH